MEAAGSSETLVLNYKMHGVASQTRSVPSLLTGNQLASLMITSSVSISDTLAWEEITTGGSVPSRRLNFSLVLVQLPHKFEKTQEQIQGDNQVEQNNSETKEETAAKTDDETEPYVPYILLHGGMDEIGNIYDDFYVMSLHSGKYVMVG